MTRSQPARSYSRSRSATSSTEPTSARCEYAGEPVVEARLARDALVQLSRALERVGVGLADQAAGHRRVAQRAAGRLARVLHLRADAREVLGRGERRVVLVGEARGRLGGAARAAAADEERRARLLHRLRLRRRVLERVVRAAEVDALFGPEPVHDLELLGEHLRGASDVSGNGKP